MQDFPIVHETMLEALHTLRDSGEITYQSFSNDWIIKFERKGTTHFIYANKFDLNSRASADIATDKVATYELLDAEQIAAVPHFLLTTPITPKLDEKLLHELFARYRQLVIKPTHGGRGQGISTCANLEAVITATHDGTVPSWCAAPWLDLRRELRLVVLHGKLALAYEKYNPQEVDGLKMFNLHFGSKARHLDIQQIDPELQHIACNAMEAIGLTVGAVDIVFDQTGKSYILEINGGFSLERYAALNPAYYAEVVAFYKQLILA